MNEIKQPRPKNWRNRLLKPKRTNPDEHTFDVMLKNGIVIHECIWACTEFKRADIGVTGFHAVLDDGLVPIDSFCIEKWRPA